MSQILEERLDGAYQRVLRLAIGLSTLAVVAAIFAAGWKSSLGVMLGASIGILNFVWLHQGAELLVRRMIAAGENAGSSPSKLRVWLFFPLRYMVVIAAVYAILKGYPGVLVSFIVGLAVPVFALMGEGVYEAAVLQRETNISD